MSLIAARRVVPFGSWTLVIRRERQAEMRLSFDGEIIIGCDPDCDLVLQGPGVSAIHCRLYSRGDQLYVSDIASLGVVVNGRPCKIAPITPGDQLDIGRYALAVTRS